jgi:hypothetical protein
MMRQRQKRHEKAITEKNARTQNGKIDLRLGKKMNI